MAKKQDNKDTKRSRKQSTDDTLDGLNAAERLQQKLNQRIEQGSKLLDKYNGNLDLATKYQNSLKTSSQDINKATEANVINSKKLTSLKQELGKANQGIVDSNNGINEINKDILARQQEINDLIKSGATEDVLAIKELGLKYQYEELRNQKKSLKYQQDITKEMQDEINVLPEKIKNNEKNIKYIQSTLDLTSKNLDTLEEIAKNKREIGKEDFKSLNYSKDIKDVEDQIADAIYKGQTNLAASLTERRDILTVAQKEAEAQDKLNSKITASRDKIVELGDKILNLVPGGKEGFLGKMLGLDTISKNLKDKVGGAMADAFKSAGGGLSGFFKAGISGAGALLAAIGPILPLLLAIGAAVAIASMIFSADKEVTQLSKDLNITKKQAADIKGEAVGIAQEMHMVGVNSKEVLTQVTDLYKATGINFAMLAKTNDKAKEFLETSTALTAQYGLTAEETLQLNAASAIAGTTVEKMTLMADKFGDDIVSSADIMKDISKVSKKVLFNFKGNAPALAAAVKQAKLMGTSLDKMADSMDSVLDIESSVTAENKARLLLGKNINMNAARYYALTGDTASYMDEIRKQAGSVADYEKMIPMQRKALADALGMSADALDDMMAKQKELEAIGLNQEEVERRIKAVKTGQMSDAEAMAGLSSQEARDTLMKKINEERRVSIQEKLMNTLTKIQDALYKAIEPLLPTIDAFVDSLGNGQSITSGLMKSFKAIGNVLSMIARVTMPIISGLWQGISFVLSPIISGIGWIADKIAELTGSTKDAKNEFGGLKVIAGIIGGIIAGWFVLKTISKVTDAFSSMYDKAKGIGSTLQSGFKNIKEGKLPSLKKKSPVEEITSKAPEVDTKGAEKSLKDTKSFADRLNSMFKSINDTFKAIFKGIGDMLKNIFDFIKDTVNTITDFISNVMTKLLKTIKTIGKELATTLKSLLKSVEKILLKTVKVVKSVGKELIKSFGEILDTVADVIKGAGVNIVKAFGSLLGSVIEVIGSQGANVVNAIGDILGAIIGVIDTQGTALINMLGNIGQAVGENVFKIVNTLLDGLGEAAGKLPGILGSLGKAVGSFFQGLGSGLLAFGEMMATPTPFGVPVGLIVVGMAIGLATAARIAAPAISALGTMFGGLAKALSGFGDLIEGVGKGIAAVITAIGDSAANFVTAVADSLIKMGSVDAANLLGVGAALVVLAAGLAALTAGSIISGIASFFGAGPADMLQSIADVNGNAIKATADGIKTLTSTLKDFKSIDAKSIENIGDALNTLSDGMLALTGGSLISGITSFFGAGPVDLLKDLAGINSNSLQTIAKSIDALSVGMSKLAGTALDSVGDSIANLTESLDDLSDIDGGDLMDVADAINKMAIGFVALNTSLSKLPADAIAKVKELATVAGQTTGQGLFGSITGSVGSAIDSVKTGFSSITGSITGSISSGFSNAWDAVSGWFGKSPSEVGHSILKGISSVQDGVTDSLTTPFTSAADTVNGTVGTIKDSISSIPAVIGDKTDVSGIENLQNVDVEKIKNVSTQLKAIDINSIKETLTQLSEALDVIDWDQLKSFSDLADSNLQLAAQSLVNGINALTGISKEINLSALEDTFDLLEDALDELDFEQLGVFASLANSDLSKAGQNIIAGINSIGSIDTSNIDLSGTEDTFDLLEDALSELDLDDLVQFGSLANVSFSGIADSLKSGIESLAGIGDKSDQLGIVEDTFDLLEDALSELDLDDLVKFGSLGNVSFSGIADSLKSGIESLASIGDRSKELSGVENTFDLLEDAIDELDLEALTSFANMQLDPTLFSSIVSSLYSAITSLSMIGDKSEQLSGVENTFGALEDTLDELDLKSIQKFSELKLDPFIFNLNQLATALNNLPAISLTNLNLDPLLQVPEVIEELSDMSVSSDTFKVFDILASIDSAKITAVADALNTDSAKVLNAANGLAQASPGFRSFNDTLLSLDDAIEDKGDMIVDLLDDLTDIDYTEIDGLANSINNLAASYTSLSTSIKMITDEDIARIQQISSVNTKSVAQSNNWLADWIDEHFGNDEETNISPKITTSVAQPTINPIMESAATVSANSAEIAQSNISNNTPNNINSAEFKKMTDLLGQILTKIDQPVVLKIGDRALWEMDKQTSARRSFAANSNLHGAV